MANNNHFELTLDTLAPTGSITRPAQYCKAQEVCTIAKGDATFMYAWTDKTEDPSFDPATKTRIDAINSYTTECDGDGVYYAHVVLMDDVNNRSAVLTTQSITYDLTAPEVKNPNPKGEDVEITLRDGTKTEITRTREVAITFYFSDNLSGVKSYTLSGDLADDVTKTGILSTQEIAAGYATRNIVLSGSGEEDTSKTVSVTVTDNSGNTSAAVSDSIILDTEFLKGNIVLKQGTKQINSQWTNTAPVTVQLSLNHKTEDDVVAYKIYGAGLADPDTNWVSVTKGSAISVEKNFSTGDSANKVVEAIVRDDAGNETTLTSVFAKVDYSAPTVSIAIKSGETPYVSKVSGFTTKDLVPTVDASISGVASYTWKMDGNPYPDGTGTTAPTEFQVDSVNMGAGGAKVAKSFTLTVVDNAGNTTTSEPVVVYLDTVAPTGSITMPAWLNGDAADQTTYKKFSTAGATASATDGGAGMAYMTCWCSQTAVDETVVGTQVTYAANPTHSQIDWTGHGESATNYIHIKYVDAVGNAAIIHSAAFGIDTVPPTGGAVAFTRDAYPSTTAAVNLILPTDATSDMTTGAKFKIWGNITEAATEQTANWQAIAASKSVTLTTGDGIKTVNVKYMDVAGNITTADITDKTELDTSTPAGALILYDTDESKVIDAIRNIPDFVTRISYTDTDALGNVFYQVYGTFTYNSQAAQGLTYKTCTVYEPNKAYAIGDEILHNEGETKVYRVTTAVTAAQNTGWSAMNGKVTESTVWLPFEYDSGKQYKVIRNMYCTSGDGQKDVYLRVMDNAGNISSQVTSNFEYDTRPPIVTVTDIDHNRISKVHEYRYTSTGATTKYADETRFTFTPDSVIQAYKVCAYLDEEAAREDYPGDDASLEKDAWIEAQVAIPTTGGSVNMSATGLSSSAAVNAMIRGADYEAALGDVGEVDGGHFVVVYVQDLGGTWSVAASFET